MKVVIGIMLRTFRKLLFTASANRSPALWWFAFLFTISLMSYGQELATQNSDATPLQVNFSVQQNNNPPLLLAQSSPTTPFRTPFWLSGITEPDKKDKNIIVINPKGVKSPAPTITIGSSTSGTMRQVPIDAFLRYNYTQCIYLQSEIANAGNITQIQFHYNGNSAFTDYVTIYIGHTSKSSFSSTSNWVSTGSMTNCYSGNYSVSTSAGWHSITLSSAFNYNNSNNLVVAVDASRSSGSYDNGDFFYTTSQGSNRSLYYGNSSTNPNPSSPPTATARSSYCANIRLVISSSAPTITSNPVDHIVEEGGTATFSVTASGSGLSYQWKKDNSNISGATSSSYTTPACPDSYDGSGYKCVVTNSGGSVTSSEADLTVIDTSNALVFETGTSVGQHQPTDAYYDYSYTQQIFLQSELAAGGSIDIDTLYFEWNGYQDTSRTMTIYMAHTSKTTFSGTSDYVASAGLTQVFSGTYSLTTDVGWHAIVLDDAFTYNNSDNLLLVIDDNSNHYAANSCEFYCHSAGADRGLYFYQDNSNIDPASPSASNSAVSAYRSNVLFKKDNNVSYTTPVAGAGDCMVFDGTGDYVAPSTYLITSSTWTLEFWIKPNSVDDADRIFIQGSDAYASRQLMAVWDNDDDQIEFKTSTTGTSGTADVASSTITDDGSTWTHVAWTSNDDVYVNGTSSTGSLGSSNYGIAGNTYVGCRAGSQNYFNGSLDEVRLWGDVRTQTEIQDYMYETIDSSTSAAATLILYYRFDEASGTTALDHSDVTQNGTITGATYATSEAWKTRTTDDDTPLTLCGGYDPNGDAITLSQTVAPTDGTLLFDNTNINVIYVPDINANSADNFTFQIDDGSETDTYAMTVTNSNVNIAPVAGAGNYLVFDGSDEYVMLPSGDMVNGTWTLEFWVKPNSPDNHERLFILGDDATTNRQIMALWYSDHLEFRTSTTGADGTPNIATTTITDDNSTWTHVAWVYNGASHTVYRNGQSVSGTVGGGTVGIGGDNYIGCRNGSQNYWTGGLDEIRLWDDARTEAEIDTNMYKALNGNEANLVGYWRFDESSGDVAYDYAGDDDHGLRVNMESGDWSASDAWKYMTTPKNVDTTHGGGYDPDGDAVTLTTSSAPSSGTLTYNNTVRAVNYDPATDATGVYTYTYQIADASLNDTYDMSVTVIGGEDYDSWTYNQNLYLNTTTSGANVSENVLNFPLCVKLDTTNFRFGQAESDGTDLRFAKSDGTHLSFEREQWSLSTNDSVAVFWVLLDTIYGNNNTQYIKMHWGKSGATDSSVSSDVFKTGSGYDFKAVWHAHDAANSLSDATSNSLTMTDQSPTTDATYQVKGLIGYGVHLDNSNSNRFSSSFILDPSATDWTLETYIYLDRLTSDKGGNNGMFSNKDGTGGTGRSHFYVNNGTDKMTSWSTGVASSGTLLMDASNWYHVALVHDDASNNALFYVNGELDTTIGSFSPSSSTDGGWVIGSNKLEADQYFHGILDEIRVSNAIRSASWFKLNYENQRLAQTLIEYEDYTSWNYSSTFAINTTSSGAGVTSDITDFPLLIRLDTSNFVFTDAQSDGSDIRFSRNGKHLYFETERWDNSGEEAEVWVRIDTIYGDNASQFITMHYGKSSVLNRSKGERVFDVSEGYHGVWHLAENGNTTTDGYKDQTWDEHHGTGVSLTTSHDIDGIIGRAHHFDGGGSGDYINMDASSEFLISTSSKITLSAWINADSINATDGYTRIFTLHRGATSGSGLALTLGSSDNIQFYNYATTSYTNWPTTISTATDYYVTLTYDGTDYRMYRNDAIDGSAVTADITAGGSYTARISDLNDSRHFAGMIDEMRVSSVARSADWIKLCYMTQKADQSVVTTDAVELLPLTINHNTKTTKGTSDTIEVYTSQWKIIFDEDDGGGIKWLSNEATGSGTNQLDGSTNLFYLKADDNTSWNVTGVLTLLDSSNLFATILQEFKLGSQPWDVEYTIYGNGRMYVKVSTEALWSAYSPTGGVSFRVRSDVTNRGYFTETASASTSNYLLHSDQASSRFDILMALYEDWAVADSFTSTTANDWLGITDGGYTLSSGNKEVWEFMVDFGHKKWNDTTGIGKYVDDYRDIDSLEFNLGRPRMDLAWEEQLIGHWTFDEGSAGSADGATVGDSSLGTHTGTIEGGTWSDGQMKYGVLFDGNDSVALANNSDFDYPYEFTIAAWIKKSGTGESDDMVFGKFNPGTGEGYKLYCDADKLKAKVYNLDLVGATSLGTGWRHVALTSNQHAGYTKLYVDGKPDAVYLGKAFMKSSSLDASIGNSFNGTLDDVRFFTKEISEGSIRALAQKSFRVNNGMYMVRTDNNNTVDLTIDGTGDQPEYFPIFQIVNYWATAAPKAVYYDGAWLSTPKDYLYDFNDAYNTCVIGFNRRVTKSDLRIYIDEQDSSGAYMTGPMPAMTYGASGNDYYVQNFTGSTFGSSGSNQFYWYWTMDTTSSAMCGELTKFASSEVSPSTAVSSATNICPTDTLYGTFGYVDHNQGSSNATSFKHVQDAKPTYTVLEASPTRVRLQIDERDVDGPALNYDLTTIWTIYPTGQIYRYDTLDANNVTISYEFVRFRLDYEDGYSRDSSKTDYRCVLYNTTNTHDHVLALLGTADKNGNTQLFTGRDNVAFQNDGTNYMGWKFDGTDDRSTTDDPYKYAYYIDIRHQNMSSAYMDSVCDPIQTIATVDADMITGDLVDTAEGDLNSDGFCEAEGAYILRASDNSVHFNLDADGATDGCQFYPAFRIINYTAPSKPRYVKMYTTADTISLVDGYTYNCYLNDAADELIVQLDTVLCNDVKLYFDYDDDLAVTLGTFTAKGGDGHDTLFWRTESESQNLGFWIHRRVAPTFYDSLAAAIDSSTLKASLKGAGLLFKNGTIATEDTQWVSITKEIIPGADGGTSHGPIEYVHLDFGLLNHVLYEYKLEVVSMDWGKEEHGPVAVMPLPILPGQFMLFHNFPNPVKHYTLIRFDLPEKSSVSLNVYNLQGRLVSQLVRPGKKWKPGFHRIRWDCRDNRGRKLASGPYIYRLQAGTKYAKSRLMILLK